MCFHARFGPSLVPHQGSEPPVELGYASATRRFQKPDRMNSTNRRCPVIAYMIHRSRFEEAFFTVPCEVGKVQVGIANQKETPVGLLIEQ